MRRHFATGALYGLLLGLVALAGKLLLPGGFSTWFGIGLGFGAAPFEVLGADEATSPAVSHALAILGWTLAGSLLGGGIGLLERCADGPRAPE